MLLFFVRCHRIVCCCYFFNAVLNLYIQLEIGDGIKLWKRNKNKEPTTNKVDSYVVDFYCKSISKSLDVMLKWASNQEWWT